MLRRTGVVLACTAVLIVSAFGVYYVLAVPQGQGATTPTTTTSTSVGSTPGAGSDWTTYQHDNSRSGDVGAFTVTSAKMGWVSPELDGRIYAEPLAFGGDVFVATENDTVYALNADTGSLAWRSHLGAPVLGSTLPCGDISPSGITGTPVIDSSTGTIYLVTFDPPANHTLVALDASDGKVIFSRPADPPGADPRVQQQRAALTLANGMVYWLYGGLDGDCGQYHGWVVGLSENGTGSLLTYQVPTGREGGIWATSGAVVDSAGDLYVATGNGDSTTAFDHGDSVIKLSPTLQELGYFAPINWSQLNQQDTDLGSAGPSVVGGMLFQIGKEGTGYLLNENDLGGIGGQVYSRGVCSGAYGGLAVSNERVFVPCTDGLTAVNISGSAFSVAWRGPSFVSGPPVVTGNVVWALDTTAGALRGFDGATGAPHFTFEVGGVTRFASPSFAYGEVFVAAGDAVHSFALGS